MMMPLVKENKPIVVISGSFTAVVFLIALSCENQIYQLGADEALSEGKRQCILPKVDVT
jgi:hypothetical protein